MQIDEVTSKDRILLCDQLSYNVLLEIRKNTNLSKERLAIIVDLINQVEINIFSITLDTGEKLQWVVDRVKRIKKLLKI